jgi:hypothetical protein
MNMLKQVADNLNATRFADTALAASRQVWLAGLGAAIVTREWARSDAGQVFRTLVKEGQVVEKRAIRVIGSQVDSSLSLATSTWNKARYAALSSVNELVDTAAAALPKFKVPLAAASKAPAKSKRIASHKKASQPRRVKRSARKA